MATEFLNNNQVATILNEAVAQSTGGELQNLDLQGIIDVGNDPTIIGTKEQFCKALLNVITKNWFTDTSYRSQYKDSWFLDESIYGSFIQAIHMKYPEARNSHRFEDFNPSVGTKTVGSYEIFCPLIETQVFGITNSFEVNISISEDQLLSSFHSASELSSFVNYIHMMVDNAIVMKLEEMDMLNRNNFIGEKIAYAGSDDAVGVHVINLVKVFHDTINSSVLTASQFLRSADCLRWAASQINIYSDYFKKMSKNFNTAQYDRFTPKDRQVLQVLSDFDSKMKTFSIASTYNPEYVSLKNYETIPYWQSCESYDFDTVSSISIKTATGETIEESGIVAFLADKYAIMHTIKNRKNVAKEFEPEGIITTFSQFKESYCNDLSQNAIVFLIKDITA